MAAGVLVAPLPSLDLLVLAAANGLMLREMARLWDCPWSLEQLQAAATQLARAALDQAVALLAPRRPLVDALVEALIDQETIEGPAFRTIVERFEGQGSARQPSAEPALS